MGRHAADSPPTPPLPAAVPVAPVAPVAPERRRQAVPVVVDRRTRPWVNRACPVVRDRRGAGDPWQHVRDKA